VEERGGRRRRRRRKRRKNEREKERWGNLVDVAVGQGWPGDFLSRGLHADGEGEKTKRHLQL